MRLWVLALASLAAVLAVVLIAHWSANAPLALPSRAPVQAGSESRVTLTSLQQGQAVGVGGFVQTPRSLLRVKRPMHYGDFIWKEENVPLGPVSIRIDLRTQILSVFRGGHEIGTAVILFGADAKQTPLGSFPILWKGKNHRSSLYDAPMPFTLRLTGDGIAIHGSEVRWGAATHGCIGVPTEFARHVYGAVDLGDPVVILRTVNPAKQFESNRA